MLKLCDNPDVLFPAVDDLSTLPGTWFVGQTKARCEKAFATDLAGRGIAYFLPMIERITFSGGRKRRGMMPLFANYVFFCAADESDRQTALLTDRLCRVIDVRDQDRLVRELSMTHRVLRNKVALDPYPFAVVGRRVRVALGPLEGTEGVVVRRDGREKLVLEVGILGQGSAMEIAPELLEPIDSPVDVRQRRAS
jgi:transcription antitermination factor NusG